MELNLQSGVHRIEFNDSRKLLRNRGSKYIDYLNEFDRAGIAYCPKQPMYIVLEVNNYCNMRCKMCVRGMNEQENNKNQLDIDLIKKIASEVESMEIPSIFLGGC